MNIRHVLGISGGKDSAALAIYLKQKYPTFTYKSEGLSTSAMNRVFDDTTASYKFYRFLSLLDMYVKNGQEQMLALDIWQRRRLFHCSK